MDRSHRPLTRWLLIAVPLLAIGCMPAEDAGHYETVHAYNKVTGKYFDVKVPYRYESGPDGAIVEREPTREETDATVDEAVWNAESSSSIDDYLHGRSSSTNSSSQSDWQSRSPMDTTTPVEGNSYHEPTPFDDDDQSGAAPPIP